MSAELAAGLGLALASTAALNWGFFTQHAAASELPRLSIRRPVASLRNLFADLRWLTGFLAGIGGWALYIAALVLAPLSLVQAASAGGIGLLALLVSRGHALTTTERRGVLVSIAGLALLGLSLAGTTTQGSTPSWAAVGAWIVVSALVAGAATLGGASGLGAAAGVLYAAGDVATKAAVHGGGWLTLVPIVLACHGLAFVALQLAFQRGGALATVGISTLCTNALPIAAGTLVFAEGLGSLPALRVLAFVCTVLGATLLARTPGPREPEEEALLPSAGRAVRFD